MTKQAFDKIAAGLEDAIAFTKGDKTRAGFAQTVDVKAIRAATKLSQAKFAETYHLPIATIQDWEQQRRTPDTPARVLLSLIEADPKGVAAIIGTSMQ